MKKELLKKALVGAAVATPLTAGALLASAQEVVIEDELSSLEESYVEVSEQAELSSEVSEDVASDASEAEESTEVEEATKAEVSDSVQADTTENKEETQKEDKEEVEVFQTVADAILAAQRSIEEEKLPGQTGAAIYFDAEKGGYVFERNWHGQSTLKLEGSDKLENVYLDLMPTFQKTFDNLDELIESLETILADPIANKGGFAGVVNPDEFPTYKGYSIISKDGKFYAYLTESEGKFLDGKSLVVQDNAVQTPGQSHTDTSKGYTNKSVAIAAAENKLKDANNKEYKGYHIFQDEEGFWHVVFSKEEGKTEGKDKADLSKEEIAERASLLTPSKTVAEAIRKSEALLAQDNSNKGYHLYQNMHGEWFVYLQPKAEKTYGIKFQEITDQDIKDAIFEGKNLGNYIMPDKHNNDKVADENSDEEALPATGEASNTAIFGVAALSILSGLGLVARRKKA